MPISPRADEGLAACREPLLRTGRKARPSIFGTDALSEEQQRLDERFRTLSLVLLSVAILGLGAYYLRPILVRLVVALALYYLLMPLIDMLRCRGIARCKYKPPRVVAIFVALMLTAGVLSLVGAVVVRSIRSFAAHADQYHGRLEQLLGKALSVPSHLGLGDWLPTGNSTEMQSMLNEMVHHLSISHMIMELLGKAATTLENVIYILLFLAFLLVGDRSHEREGDVQMHATQVRANEQIYLYIRGKVLIGLLVGLLDGFILWALGVQLWLVFAVLAFWLSFVPNIGFAMTVCLPMPLVALDPSFSAARIALAFFGPLAVGMAAKDVLEPLLIGHSTSLTPVAVLLSVMLWGSIWGVTGMVLAVPLTAVARIHMEGLEHPLPRYFAAMLSGTDIELQPGNDDREDSDAEQAKALGKSPPV